MAVKRGSTNNGLTQAITLYSTGAHDAFKTHVGGLSKSEVTALFTELMTMYINDRNSSSLREYVTVTIAGYTHVDDKLGFDGFKITGGKKVWCEAKPRNARTEDLVLYKAGKRKTRPARLDAGGSFNDYTYTRLAKDKKENPKILASGFLDGKLLYVLEIPFNAKGIIATLTAQLAKRFPNGPGVNQYLRGASFSFKNYKDDKALVVRFIAQSEALAGSEKYVAKDLYDYLVSYGKTKK